MDISVRINKWVNNFRKYMFFYKDGYFELPYLSNSPEIMVNSFKNLPFTRFLEEENAIYSNTIFSNGSMRYRELEPGLWIIVSEMEFKKNICTKALYDGEPCDYYFLSHFRYTSSIDNILINDFQLPKVGWSLYKPGTEISAYFKKGDKGIFINFIFNSTWFSKNISINNLSHQSELKQYINSDESYIVWNDLIQNSSEQVKRINELLKDTNNNPSSSLIIKAKCFQIISDFFDRITDFNMANGLNKLPSHEKSHLANAEKIILLSLTNEFPGIETIAQKVHMSPTKLKILFKDVYGKSMFQYYQEKQMNFAYELLQNRSKTIKEVSEVLGYDNPSNFTIAFKKVYNILPSQVTESHISQF